MGHALRAHDPLHRRLGTERRTTFLGHILGQVHSIAGNPDRLRAGPVEVRLDDGWKREMMPVDRRLVTALTWPLLSRYGYLGG